MVILKLKETKKINLVQIEQPQLNQLKKQIVKNAMIRSTTIISVILNCPFASVFNFLVMTNLILKWFIDQQFMINEIIMTFFDKILLYHSRNVLHLFELTHMFFFISDCIILCGQYALSQCDFKCVQCSAVLSYEFLFFFFLNRQFSINNMLTYWQWKCERSG